MFSAANRSASESLNDGVEIFSSEQFDKQSSVLNSSQLPVDVLTLEDRASIRGGAIVQRSKGGRGLCANSRFVASCTPSATKKLRVY